MICKAELWACLRDIPGSDTFVKIDPVTKGWSDDKKYYIETIDRRRMLLRVSDIAEYDHKKSEFEKMGLVYHFGVYTSEPLCFGLCDSGKSCYSLSGWLNGNDAEKALPLMSETEQYVLGLKTGETLRKIHGLPATEGNTADWAERYFSVMDERIMDY